MWKDVEWIFSEAFDRLGGVLAKDLPSIVAMIVVVLSATLVAFGVRGLLRFGLGRVGFDRHAREWGMTAGRALEPHHEPSWLVARGAFWFVIVSGAALALAVLGASTTSAVGLSLLGFLPRLVVGAVILVVGIGAARFLERSVLIEAVNQRIAQARLVAIGVKWIVLLLAGAMALQHVGVGGSLPTIAFSILVGGVVLGAALAFGLGAREAVARSLEHRDDGGGAGEDERREERISHL